MTKKRILIISGATASGKSALALHIAQKRNGLIINADAMQQYSGLPILSAQPSKDDQKAVSHFLYSILKPDENSSVADWLLLARKQIDQALDQGKLPIIVGGTGLYISKLMDGINKIPEIDENLKLGVRDLIKNSSREELIKILIDLKENPDDVVKLDKQRLGRRIEVLKQTGKTLSWWQNQPNEIFYPQEYFEHIQISLPREILYKNCDERLKLMFDKGAIEEVKSLVNQGFKPESLMANTIGFLEIKDYLEGKISLDEALKTSQQKTRNYAKRQMTWFRNQFKKHV